MNFFSKSGILGHLFFTLTVFAGPNQNALVSVDLNPATTLSDSSRNLYNDSSFWIAVRVSNCIGLDGYGFEISFDTTLLTLQQVVPLSLANGWSHFLESQGGVSAGFIGQRMKSDSTKISIANSLIGLDSAKSPNGNGILAYIQFQPKPKTGNIRFTLGTITLLDWRQQVDAGLPPQGANGLLLARPVHLSQLHSKPAFQSQTHINPFDSRFLLGRYRITQYRR